MNRLLEAARHSSIGAHIHVAAFTGLRQSELLGLRWQDLDFEKSRLRVKQTVRYIPGRGFVFRKTKTQRGNRTVSPSLSAVDALKSPRVSQARRRLLLGTTYRSEFDLVFAVDDGGPVSARNMYRTHQKVVAEAGIPKGNWHALRHSHASFLLQQGAPVAFVSERLGHANPSVTFGLYSHAVNGLQDAYADQIDAWMTPEKKRA